MQSASSPQRLQQWRAESAGRSVDLERSTLAPTLAEKSVSSKRSHSTCVSEPKLVRCAGSGAGGGLGGMGGGSGAGGGDGAERIEKCFETVWGGEGGPMVKVPSKAYTRDDAISSPSIVEIEWKRSRQRTQLPALMMSE